MNSYYAGNRLKITATFLAGTAYYDPSVITGYVMDTDGSVVTYVYNTDDELTRESAGVYNLSIEIPLDASKGLWRYGITGETPASTYISAQEGEFYVLDWPFD